MRSWTPSEARPRFMSVFLILLLSVSMLASVFGPPARVSPVHADAPLVLAMYYAWFDGDSWDSSRLSDLPSPLYHSADVSTMQRHVGQAKSAGIDAFALNWWGPGNPTDTNLQRLLDVSSAAGFRVTLDFDMNSPFVAGPSDVVRCLEYASNYFGHPAWLRYEGKPVVFFYGNRRFSVDTWAGIRQQVDPGHQALWIGEGDIFSYLSVFDGIHPYSIAWSPDPASQLASYAARARATDAGKLWVATVMPGYDDTRSRGAEGFARDRQGGAFYAATWEGALNSRPAMVSITSWNEWAEGSHIEPSLNFGNTYLQLTAQFAAQYKAGFAPAPSPPRTAPGGANRFYSEAGGGQGGYWLADADGVAMLAAVQRLGGVESLGYPSTRRFELGDGFVYQATQGALLQARPGEDVVLANTFELLRQAGKDTWLDEAKGLPKGIVDDGSNGDWSRARQIRLGWLTNDAIKARYLSVGSEDRAIQMFGLPMSMPERRGPFVVQRFQRAAFQLWLEAAPGMPLPGSVVWVLGGDLLKESGLIPSAAMMPESP